jgi:hypothetical protein
MAKILRVMLVLLAVGAMPGVLGGCSSEKRDGVVRPVEPRAPAQTRPAIPVEEERPWYENAGEVAVIVVGAIFIIGGIVGGALLAANAF